MIDSYYDSNNNFRGKAIFETREDAERYLESYQTKIDSRVKDLYMESFFDIKLP
jgi:hypothetical protein